MKRRHLALALGMLLFSSACAPYRATVEVEPTESDSRVLFLDVGNVVWLRVVRMAVGRGSNGQMEVRLQLLNKGLTDATVDLKVEFRDGHGFELESTGFTPVFLRSGVSETYRTSSISDSVQDFRVYVRNAK